MTKREFLDKLKKALANDLSATTQMDYWKWINDPWPWQEGGC